MSPASEPASQTSSSTSCAGGGLLARLSRTPFCYVPGLRVRRRGLRLRRLEDGTRRLCFYVSLFSWFSLELPCFGEFSVFALGGFSPSHWATHVLPKCPSYQEECPHGASSRPSRLGPRYGPPCATRWFLSRPLGATLSACRRLTGALAES
jgi:hypothetical protein